MNENEIMREARKLARRERLADAWIVIASTVLVLSVVAYSLAPIWW